MPDFGTGLRAHLASSRGAAGSAPEPAPAAVAPAHEDRCRAEAVSAEQADRSRLEALAAELTGRELELARREADLVAEQEEMARALARILLEQARAQETQAPVDELAALRARRYGRAS
jgi:hypothetical protein